MTVEIPLRTSAHKGVHWERRRSVWVASIKVNRRGVFLGQYADPAEAARAYDAAARHHFGEFARLNFPEESA